MNVKFRAIILCLCAILPNAIKLFAYRNFFSWTIGKGVKIGMSIIDVDNLDIGNDVKIGHFNIIRTIRNLKVGSSSTIKNFNQFNGGRKGDPNKWRSELIIGNNVKVMSHHFIDACGEVLIHDYATLAGRGSHLWSHTVTYIDDGTRNLVPTRIEVGSKAYVGANSVILGCRIPSLAMVGAGSLVNKQFTDTDKRVLIAGNPATVKKEYLSKS